MDRCIAIEKYKDIVKEARSIFPNPRYKELLDESRSLYWEYKIKTKERKDVIPLFGEIIKQEQEAHKKKRAMEKEIAEQRKSLKKKGFSYGKRRLRKGKHDRAKP